MPDSGRLLDLRLLRHFVVLAEELHFGRAAQRLHISQPPLSKQIQQLEERIGTPLFDRAHRSVQLTPAGVALAREARRLLAQAELALHEVKHAHAAQGGRVRIAFVPAALFMEVEQAFRQIRALLPDVETTWEEMGSAEQVKALQQDRIDLGFVHAPQNLGAMARCTVARVALVAAIPADHALVNEDHLKLTNLADEAFISLPREVAPGFHDLVISVCLAAGFSPRILHQARHFLSIISLVAVGQGIAIVPQSLLRATVPGVVFKPLQDVTAHAEYSVIWNPRNPWLVLTRILEILGATPTR